MATRLVVFDVVGTTIRDDGAVQSALRDAVGRAGLQLRDGAMSGVAGMSKLEAIRTLLEGHGRDELLPRAPAIHAEFVAGVTRHYRTAPTVSPVEGAAAVFAALRGHGVRVALGTGFSREVLDVILDRVGWSGAASPLDATVASDEVRRGRPYPDMIDALRTRLGGIASAEVAKVGDTPVDLHEGTMARCGLVVGVLSGAQSRQTLEAHPHDALLDSLAELPQLLADRGLIPE